MSLESDASPPELTPMQLECLRRAASTDKEIARELSISPDTVSNHVRNAMRRLQAGDRRTPMARLGAAEGALAVVPVPDNGDPASDQFAVDLHTLGCPADGGDAVIALSSALAMDRPAAR